MNHLLSVEALMADYSMVPNVEIVAANDDDTRQSAQAFRIELLAAIPQLRAFARMLSSDKKSAEDLSLETLAEAWRSRDVFGPRTNLRTWLFTIARNKFHSGRSGEWRQAPLEQTAPENDAGKIPPADISGAERALQLLPDRFREALILVSAGGCTYEEAAQICDCPLGTVKSRVFRARLALMAKFDTLFL